MEDKGTSKKVTKVQGSAKGTSQKTFTASKESKGRALRLRIFAFILWFIAIVLEVGAIFILQNPPINMIILIAFLAAIFVFALLGSILWKKANRLDPASEKDKVKFFVQNQLGMIISIIAFLPLIILIFTNKDLKGKDKGIAGGIAIALLVAAGLLGADFNPPSIEQYTEQTAEVEYLMGENSVYWTKSGNRYHLYSDCQHINTSKTDEIFNGTVAQARELKNISELCKTCASRAERVKAAASGQ